MRPFILVNANTVRPPIGPVGLEYVAQALVHADIPVEMLDLAFQPEWEKSLARSLSSQDPLAVGIAVRNTDDCCLATGKSFVLWIAQLVAEAKKLTSAPVVLGGGGFSIFYKDLLSATGADIGIYGDGEDAAVLLGRALVTDGEVGRIPNLVYRDAGYLRCNIGSRVDAERLPLPLRRMVDNARYQREGAMVGIETKRGCPNRCIYCADPVVKGREMRVRPPRVVADEMEDLLAQGVSWYHLCDSEFNIPIDHAKEVCRELIGRGLNRRIAWYTYCAPLQFDLELAMLMKQAGCAGVNFGVDSLHDGQLGRMGRDHRMKDIEELTDCLRRAGLNFIFDLLIGGPGETEKTVRTSVETARSLNLPLVGMAVGVRIYPGTGMERLMKKGRLSSGMRLGSAAALWEPTFYASTAMGEDPQGLVHHVVEGDRRFLLLETPEKEDSYNYVGDDSLASAIQQGARGAYWDILEKTRRRENPQG